MLFLGTEIRYLWHFTQRPSETSSFLLSKNPATLAGSCGSFIAISLLRTCKWPCKLEHIAGMACKAWCVWDKQRLCQTTNTPEQMHPKEKLQPAALSSRTVAGLLRPLTQTLLITKWGLYLMGTWWALWHIIKKLWCHLCISGLSAVSFKVLFQKNSLTIAPNYIS